MEPVLTSWSGCSTPPERWVAFYVRVTKEESVKTDLSIPNQVARATEVAALRKWEHWKIYIEPKHVSGELWLNKRPALRELVQDVNAGRVNSVCARHTDRLWRTSEIQAQLLSILRKHSVDVWDFSQRHEYTTAHGRFSLQVLGAAAELEVNLTAERIREMKRGKARKGKTGGGPPPFGYTSQSRRLAQLLQAGYDQDEAYAKACTEFPVGKRWFIDENEAQVVRLIYELYTGAKHRMGSKRIGRHLNAHGHKTRTGMAWLATYVRRLLSNPAYAGYTSYDEESYEKRVESRLPRDRQKLYKGEHEPLVSVETWKKAQDDRKEGATSKRDGREASERRIFALTGILRCPSCRSPMIGKWSNHSTRSYYNCSRRHNGGPDLCSFPMLDADQLHRETWRWVHMIISSPEYLAQHLSRLQSRLQRERPEAEQKLDRTRKRMDEIRAALRKYYALFEGSNDSGKEQVFAERMTQLRSELVALESEVTALQAQITPSGKPAVTLAQMRAYLSQLEDRGAERPDIQKGIFHELKRQHRFTVRATSSKDIVLSIDLSSRSEPNSDERSNLTNPAIRRFYSVVGSNGLGGGSRGPGLPQPRAHRERRLWVPRAAAA
jgi:site-specific DNA recombinase